MAKKKPFEGDDDDQSERAANEAAAKTLKERVQQAKDPGEGELEIDVESAEEDLDDLPEPQRQSRQERRKERYSAMQRERDEAKAEREKMAAEIASMRQMLEHSRGQAPQQPPPPPQRSPEEERLSQLFKEQDLLYRDYNARAAQLTPQEHEEFMRKAREYQEQIVVTGGEVALTKRGVRPVNEHEVRNQIVREQLMREHGDVLSDPRMQQYCSGVWNQLRAKGKPDDWNTIAEAADMTRQAFGRKTKNQAPPSDSYKRKLTGVGRGAGSGPAPGEGGGQVVNMTAQHRRSMADALYKHIPDKAERYKRWAAGPGRRLLDKEG